MNKAKATQVGVALAVLFLLVIGAMTINANASLPVGQVSGAKSANDTAVIKQLQAGQPLVRTAERSDISRPIRDIPVSISPVNRPEENENPLVNQKDPGMVVPKSFTD